MSSIETKIKALLDLAGNNSSQAEASAAMQKAMELMNRYGVSTEAIEDIGKEESITLTYDLKGQLIFKGCINIITIMAKYFQVFAYKHKAGKAQEVVLIGHEGKLRTCIAMIDYLLGNAKYNLPKGYSHTEKQGFYLGYFLAVNKLVTTMSEAKGPALACSMKEYQDFAGVKLKSAKRSKVTVDGTARDLGVNAGSKVNFNKQLGVRALAAG